MKPLYKRKGTYTWACGCGFVNVLRDAVISVAAYRHPALHLYLPTLTYRNGRYDVRAIAHAASAKRIFASMP